MKIAYIVYDFVRAGGIERYVRELSVRMAAAGHEVHVITARRPESGFDKIHFHLVRVLKILPGFMRGEAFRRSSESLLREHNYDIVHSQGNDCLIHNVFTVHSCHKAWVSKAKKFGWWEYLKKTIYPVHRVFVRNEEANCRRYKNIIAVSGEVKREIVVFHNVPEKDIEVIYPGVDLDKFNPNRTNAAESVRRPLGLKDDDFVILFVANEFRRKGLSNIIRALALLKKRSVKLLVVGKGMRWLYKLQALKMGLDGQVVFVRPQKDVAAYYSASDLFILPTKHEAFGMVISEAMASGLPVIVSRLAGAAELIREEKCLLNDPFDVSEIASKLGYFADNRGAARQIGKMMRSAVEQCSWDATAKRTMAVYERAAAKNV
jgi:UDP-glucose:(heptosyl)LPS alpha-1,3-glucosyltransferase